MERKNVFMYLATINLISLFVAVSLILFFADSILILSAEEFSKFISIVFPIALVLSIIHFITHFIFSAQSLTKGNEDADSIKTFLRMIKLPYNSSYHILLNLLIVAFVIIIFSITQFGIGASIFLLLITSIVTSLFFSFLCIILGDIFLYSMVADLTQHGFTLEEVEKLPFTLSIKQRFVVSFVLIFLLSFLVGVFLGKNISAIFITMVSVSVFGIFSVQTIIKRITVLKESAINLAEGKADLTTMLPVVIPDEISRASAAFNKFIKRLDELMGSIYSLADAILKESEAIVASGEQLNASIEEISSTINEVAHGAQEQSTKSNDIYKEIEKLSAITSGINSQMKMAVTSARKANEAASTGMETTLSTLEKMNDIH